MPYVIVYGTLLGAVRNATIIPWTKDIDIGLFEKNKLYSYEIREELYKHGYHLFEVNEIFHFHLILIRNSISLDINSLFFCHIGYRVFSSVYTFEISRSNTNHHAKC
jgi:hypothetical protein